MSFKYNRNKCGLVLPLVAMMALNGPAAVGQGLGNAPYSMLGLGEVMGNTLSLNQATGEAGVSSGNVMQLNNLNPALWARNRYTTFEFGGVGQFKRIDVAGANQRNLGGNIAFLALAFPITPKWTSGLTLKPYSYIDYSSSASSLVAGTPYPSVYSYSGKGAVNKVAFTNGFQIGRYVSVGLDLFYLFGNIHRSSEVMVVTGDNQDNTVGLNERLNLKSASARGGAAVRLPLKPQNKLFLNVGGTYEWGNDLAVRQTATYDLTKDSFPMYIPSDTLVREASGRMGVPSRYRAGVSLEWPLLLTISADYEYTDWDSFKSFRNPKSEQVSSVGRFYLGADYIPKMRSTRYWDLISYRAGVNFGESPYTPNGNKINETNVTVGFGLPIGRGGSTLSIAMVGGQRGLLAANALRERYLRLTLAWSFSDLWFQKPKLD